jgi:GT2 family glycosyltransferase
VEAPLARTLALAAPVRVEPILRTVRIAAIVPCFNRPADLALLASDLSRGILHASVSTERLSIHLSILVVDNASDPPLEPPTLPTHIPARLIRLGANRGGSGGYNAGMALALDAPSGEKPDYLWLIDSDARVEPDTLSRLLGAMEADPSLVAAGPALADTIDGAVHEIGGRVDRRTGRFGPASTAATADTPIACDYIAACCALVRADAVRDVGLMPDTFLNGDDVEWCIRLARESGGRVAAVPNARAAHPRFDRYATLPRYFGARNAFGPIDALGLGPLVRFRRALHETTRALNQSLMARPDLAALHLRGLRDAARGITRGLPADLPAIDPPRPLAELEPVLEQLAPRTLAVDLPPEDRARLAPCHYRRNSLSSSFSSLLRDGSARPNPLPALLLRVLTGPRYDLAIVPAKGSPAHWLLARHLIELSPAGFVVRHVRRAPLLSRSAAALAQGLGYTLRLAARPARPRPLPQPADIRALAPIAEPDPALSLSIIVLSFNRKAALLETLRRLHESPATRDAEIVVVDNASTDGSPDAVREHAPHAKLIALDANAAIAGFNRGVEAAAGDLVLILDDDARPDPHALAAAAELLEQRPDLAAVTLVPFHPQTRATEWPFADRLASPRDDWPVMGCCNLVRRAVWRAVGGYEEGFFLYRNDVDLALKILATGLGVHCNPAWRCEHDSPAAAAKSPRWFRLATRNWIWLARRHARGPAKLIGALAGWLWAHKLAGASLQRHRSALRGGLDGLTREPPPLPPTAQPDGRAFASLLRLRFNRNRPDRPASMP